MPEKVIFKRAVVNPNGTSHYEFSEPHTVYIPAGANAVKIILEYLWENLPAGWRL